MKGWGWAEWSMQGEPLLVRLCLAFVWACLLLIVGELLVGFVLLFVGSPR